MTKRIGPVGLAVTLIMLAVIVASLWSYSAVVGGFTRYEEIVRVLRTSHDVLFDFVNQESHLNSLPRTGADIDLLKREAPKLGLDEIDESVERLGDFQRDWTRTVEEARRPGLSPKAVRGLAADRRDLLDSMRFRIQLITEDVQSLASATVLAARRGMVLGALALLVSIGLLGAIGVLAERLRRNQERLAAVAREKELERVSGLAFFDQLTGLQNRASLMLSFEQILERARRSSQNVACLFVDLDGFKAVNDTLGHQSGDRVLQAVAQTLRASVRKSDIVGRIGGDEFVVVLAAVGQRSGAGTVADKVLRVLEQPIDVGAASAAHISASIGISFAPDHGSEAEALLQLADHAMYVAKRNGKNRYAVHDEAPLTSGTTP